MPKIMTIDESISHTETRIEETYKAIEAAARDIKVAYESLLAAQESVLSLFDDKPTMPDVITMAFTAQQSLIDSFREGVNTFSEAVYKAKAARTPCEPFPM